MDIILKANNLLKSYGNKIVVNNVSFNLEKGKIYGLLGPNGAGKTTIMKIITNQIDKNAGVIDYDDSLKINYLMDVPQFYEYMSVNEYMLFLTNINKIVNANEHVEKLLEITNLTEHKNKKIKYLSRGLRQKLGIASVLINEVDILILDEPISALDPLGRKEILDLIYSLKGKVTVIFSSHILEDIERVCDHILLINNGVILLDEDSENVLKRSNELLVRCKNQEEILILKEQFIDSEFSTRFADTLILKYEDLLATQQSILKYAKKFNLTVELLEKRKNSLEEVFLDEVMKNA